MSQGQQESSSALLEKAIDSIAKELSEPNRTAKSLARVIKKLEAEERKLKRLEQKQKEAAERKRQEEIARKKEEERRKEIKRITAMELPLDWENAFCDDVRAEGVHVDDPADALLHSLNNLGRVDIEYMARICGADPKAVILELKGSIIQNPETWEKCWYKGWETKDQYLSGNLMRKRRKAVDANKEFDDYFRENVTAIDSVLPDPIPIEDIYITLGSPWIPPDIIDDFANHIIGLEDDPAMIGTKHDPITGTWELPYRGKSLAGDEVGDDGCLLHVAHNAYGTDRITALNILEKTLNGRPIKIMDSDSKASKKSSKKAINEKETLVAQEQQRKMIEEFKEWVWESESRSERLQIIYENNFGCLKQRKFDGSFLKFPKMNKDITLHPYQKDAIARMIMMPNTLLAHDVGAGKTYMMIAAGMEMKRMGLSSKSLYVVPNNILQQWQKMFLELYPEANVLVVAPKDFTPKKRAGVLQEIKDNDFDAILMSYSTFSLIKVSREEMIDSLSQEHDDLVELMSQSWQYRTKKLKKWIEALHEKLADLENAISSDDGVISFDELGITRLFVDEAHNFKNVPIQTKFNNCLGISSGGSARCKDMLEKVRCVQRNNGGAGIIFATGTPITNSIADAYVMQRYLQDGELALLGLQSFDDWVSMFAEMATEFEIDVDTTNFRMATRFSKFHNLPELTNLLSFIADFHSPEELGSLPEVGKREDVVVKKSPSFETYLQDLSARTDLIRKGVVSRRADNMLKVTTDGRKAALDMRLVDPAAFCANHKAFACAEKVADVYFSTTEIAATQLVFCDISTPKNTFNLYDELKDLLLQLGVCPDHVAFVHDFDTPAQQKALFADMRAGKIRILIGSTFKIGLGVNIQNRLIAIHHLDVPWRPSDMAQREGRMIRPGNRNDQVAIYRYITDGSFDAYSWQLLETKQRFITALLSGSMNQRSMKEIDDTVLDYAEVKAIAIGDERIKQRVEAANELARLTMLRTEQQRLHDSLRSELQVLPDRQKRLQGHIAACVEDEARYEKWKMTHPDEYHQDLSSKQKKARSEYRAVIRQTILSQAFSSQKRTLSPYRGFPIIVPANISPNDAFLYIQGAAKYRVSLGTSPKGYLMRIDNFLNRLAAYKNEQEANLKKLDARETEIQMKLAEAEDYDGSIEELSLLIQELDEKLGVGKK